MCAGLETEIDNFEDRAVPKTVELPDRETAPAAHTSSFTVVWLLIVVVVLALNVWYDYYHPR